MRLGVFGGTFDPIHLGHLRLAEEAREQIALDRVLFIPNRVSPFKTHRDAPAPAADRLEMVRRAVEGNPYFVASALEVERPGPSYAIDTVRALRAEYGGEARLFLLTGSDAVRDLAGWREAHVLIREVEVVAAARPGTDRDAALAPLPPGWAARVTFIAMPALDISATDLRARVRARRSIRYFVPPVIGEYIAANGLYASAGSARSSLEKETAA